MLFSAPRPKSKWHTATVGASDSHRPLNPMARQSPTRRPGFSGWKLSAGLFDPTLPDTGAGSAQSIRVSKASSPSNAPSVRPARSCSLPTAPSKRFYRSGYCPPPSAANPLPCSTPLAGFGYGGRFELGPMHIGVAGHRAWHRAGLSPRRPPCGRGCGGQHAQPGWLLPSEPIGVWPLRCLRWREHSAGVSHGYRPGTCP